MMRYQYLSRRPPIQGRVAHAANKKKRHKHAPPELSSARPTPPGRDDRPVSTVALSPAQAAAGARDGGRRRFDPRFDPACSTGDAATAARSYGLLRNVRAAEEAALARASRAGDGDATRRLQSMKSADEAGAVTARVEDVRRGLRREERSCLAGGGKCPYYTKEAVVREKVMKTQYEELKASGRLTKYVERRRKREAQKDKRLLPPSARKE